MTKHDMSNAISVFISNQIYKMHKYWLNKNIGIGIGYQYVDANLSFSAIICARKI